jgi:hypothetical protein
MNLGHLAFEEVDTLEREVTADQRLADLRMKPGRAPAEDQELLYATAVDLEWRRRQPQLWCGEVPNSMEIEWAPPRVRRAP